MDDCLFCTSTMCIVKIVWARAWYVPCSAAIAGRTHCYSTFLRVIALQRETFLPFYSEETRNTRSGIAARGGGNMQERG